MSPARLTAAFATWQLLLHLWVCVQSGDPRLWPPHAVAFLGDLLLLGAMLAASRLAGAAMPPGRQHIASTLGSICVCALGVLLAIYPPLLREYLAFPVDIFAAGGGSARVLIADYLGVARLWPAAGAVLIAAGTLLLPASPTVRAGKRAGIAFWGIVALAGVVTFPRSPHPILYSLKQQALRVARHDRVVPSLHRPPSRGQAAVDSSEGLLPAAKSLTADHVFLLVLEGVTSADFEQEFLRGGRFFARTKDRAVYYRNYHATNLDSYTSLIAMLTAEQVPYRAYADEGLYAAVNEKRSLARSLSERGYVTAFISTYAHQPFVPVRSHWHRVLDRQHLPSLDGWVSLGGSRMEAATEDRAALGTIVRLAGAHGRTLLLHELVYGHSPEWRAKTGRTQLDYYDTYLNELLDRLESAGLAARSLLVIVSDHGDRAKAAVAENYRVPLLVVGASIQPGEDAAFRSHLDLAGIVRSHLTGAALPPSRSDTYVVGSTERWVYGSLRADGAFLFVDDGTGTVLSSRGGLDPASIFAGFQALVDRFGLRFGPSTRPAHR